jgi:hypothetical protein
MVTKIFEPRRKLYKNCLKLTQTSESVGYCSHYGEVINFCPERCPNNFSTLIKKEKNNDWSADS